MAGNSIDLIDDIDHVKKIDDSHGYTLKYYFEFLSKKSRFDFNSYDSKIFFIIYDFVQFCNTFWFPYLLLT